MLSKLHLFVSPSREFSKYIETFAAGFALVQTALHDVFAGVQSETIWFKIENVSEKKCKCAQAILKNIVENRASFMSEQVIVSYPEELLSQPL